jgi:peptidoglycan/xylan/chitin deacetylase (PgdA/CDA1 family)
MWIGVWSWRRARRRVETWYAVAAAALVALAVWWAPGMRAAAGPPPAPVYRVVTDRRAIALTINVVWGTEYVPRILAALTEAHAKATFFLGGAWAAANPGLVAQMVHDGMEIGNHGYAHRHSNQLSFDENLNEITRAARAIEVAGAPRPTLFAPPYGEFNQTVLAAAAALHQTVIMWTVDTIDWRPSSSASVIAERVLGRAGPGAIVLMHPTDRTLRALPDLIQGLTARGYRLVTVSNLLAHGTPAGES